MRASLLIPWVLACGCVSVRAAEGAPRPVLGGEAAHPIFAPRPAKKAAPPQRNAAPPKASPTRRSISPETAARLSAAATAALQGVPRPETSGPGNGSSGGEGATDAVRLEPYVVKEDKLPDLKERQLLTPKGKLDLAYKRHPGLRLGPIPLFNDGVARAIIEDELAKERGKEMADLADLLHLGDSKPPRNTQRAIDGAGVRINEKAHEPGTPFREPK